MKINFNEEHKNRILYYINEYKIVNEEYARYMQGVIALQEQLDDLKAKLQTTESNLQSIRDNEKKYMEELHSVYGDFTLNDLWESIN
jgi:predicted  nucleic acid-binding Zn-ribbon protein